MSASLENLNLEEGKSEALRATFACIAEATALDGGPRYAEKVCRDLARVIVCRSYGNALLELTHLIAVASAGGRPYEEFFWSVDRAAASAFRGSFAAMEFGPSVEVEGQGIVHIVGATGFRISYGRMPFLAAMLEFLIATIGYEAVDRAAMPLRDGAVDAACISAVTSDLQRRVYAYLKDHLPPAQRLRRERHFLAFVMENAGNKSGADAIDDKAVLDYWRLFAVDGPVDTKTYRTVYDTARKLILALDAASARHAARHAHAIGADIEAGEVDPGDIEHVVVALSDAEQPIIRLLEACGERVKLVNATEADILAELPTEPGVGRRLAVSVLRNSVYGAAQLKLTNALRKGVSNHDVLAGPDGDYYRQKIVLYAGTAASLERIAMAALWVLHDSGRAEAIDLALSLAPDLDWGVLADRDAESGNTISLAERDAARRFLEERADPRGDEVQALLADARHAHRRINRVGFKGEPDNVTVETIALVVPDLLALMADSRRFIEAELSQRDWPALEVADRAAFTNVFNRLYDSGTEAAHAG